MSGSQSACSLPAAAADSNFQTYQASPVGSWPEAVAIGDVTGDGRNDVVMTTSLLLRPRNDFRPLGLRARGRRHSSRAGLLRDGGVVQRTPESVAIGDLTGDGRSDVVVGLAGRASSCFRSSRRDARHAGVHGRSDSLKIRLGQLNGDRQLDVAGVGWGEPSVSVLLNNGSGGLGRPGDLFRAASAATTTSRSRT